MPGRRPREQVLAVGVGVRRRDDVAVAVEQVDLHAFEHVVRIVEVAVGPVIGVDAAGDRAGQQLAEVVLDAHLAPVDHDLADHVARRRNVGHAAQVARRVLAVEPAGRMNFHTEYLPARRLLNL